MIGLQECLYSMMLARGLFPLAASLPSSNDPRRHTPPSLHLIPAGSAPRHKIHRGPLVFCLANNLYQQSSLTCVSFPPTYQAQNKSLAITSELQSSLLFQLLIYNLLVLRLPSYWSLRTRIQIQIFSGGGAGRLSSKPLLMITKRIEVDTLLSMSDGMLR